MRIDNIEVDSRQFYNNMNSAFNLFTGRVDIAEQKVYNLTVLTNTTLLRVVGLSSTSENLSQGVGSLVDQARTAHQRLDALNASSVIMLASGYQVRDIRFCKRFLSCRRSQCQRQT